MHNKNTKWLIFIIVCLAYMPGSYAQYQLSVLAPELMQSFGLSTSQFSSLFTAPMIIAIFLSFAGGIISDKVGSKKVVSLAFLVAVAGLIGRIFLLLCLELSLWWCPLSHSRLYYGHWEKPLNRLILSVRPLAACSCLHFTRYFKFPDITNLALSKAGCLCIFQLQDF